MVRVKLSRNCAVLVVGAGPGGLTAAITLARYGIHVLLIDKRDTPPGLSRALTISTGGMELMRRFGLEEAIRSGAADVKIRAWMTPDLASGEGAEMPLGYPSDAEAALASPTRPAWVAQDHHEPILLEHLRGSPSADIRLGCQLLSLTQDDRGVRAVVADAATGAVETIGASYLVAADGAHSTVRAQLGIAMIGPDDLADFERVEFTAPLWRLAGANRYGLYLITRPDAGGVLAPRGAGDRWFFARETPTGTRGLIGLGRGDLTGLIQRAAGTTALRPRIERVSAWTFAAQLAERYAQGRCFLVGDAAHRATPRGGTGMNTAIQDSFDLGWKLAWVLRGWAGPDLLATYERERRPVAAHNVQRSSERSGARRETAEALPWDLGRRLPHHWLQDGDSKLSTVDLIGDRLTLLAGPADPRWARFAVTKPPNPPVDVHVIDARTAAALGLPPAGALITRPDGCELRRWADIDAAAETVAEGLAIHALDPTCEEAAQRAQPSRGEKAMSTISRPADVVTRDPVSAWARPGRAAGYVAGAALLAGTVLYLLDATGLLGPGPVYRRTSAGPLADQATFYAAYFRHQHHIVWDIIARDTVLPVAYLALIITALAVRDRAGAGRPQGQILVASFLVGGIFSILADLTFLAATQYWRQPAWPVHPAASTVAAGQTVQGIEALTQWPEAFGFAVLAAGLVALARLCGRHRVFPASLGVLAWLEALLLLGIAVTGLIPYDAGYSWLSLAAGAVAGPALSIALGARLGQAQHPDQT